MNRLRVYLLPPGWDISPLQGHPPAFNQAFLTVRQYPFTLVGGERNTLTRTLPGPVNSESCALALRPLRSCFATGNTP